MADVRTPTIEAFDEEAGLLSNVSLPGRVEPLLEQYLEGERDGRKIVLQSLKSFFDRFTQVCALRAGPDNRTIAEGRGFPQVPAGGVL